MESIPGDEGSEWGISSYSKVLNFQTSNTFLQRGINCLCLTIGPKGGFFTLLGPFFAPNSSKWPKFWSHKISNEGSHAYDPSKFLKMAKMSYFEDFSNFEDPSRAKKVLFRENSKNIRRYTVKDARNPALSRYNHPSCWNPRTKPPINELFWDFSRFWGPPRTKIVLYG